MKYMVHMTGKSENKIEEVFIFGDSPIKIRNSEDYTVFKSDGYEEETMFSLGTISGHSILPSWIARD